MQRPTKTTWEKSRLDMKAEALCTQSLHSQLRIIESDGEQMIKDNKIIQYQKENMQN